MSFVSKLHKGMKLPGESSRTYAISAPLIQRQHPHAWTADSTSSEKEDKDQFVMKHPQLDDYPEKHWPAFRKEMDMQTRFHSARYIRRMVDKIPASSSDLPDMMVLEPFEKTRWSARMRRPLTDDP